MVTLKEIANIAHVSTATVSNVLNNNAGEVSEETRERILKVLAETGYKQNRIAKSLRKNRTHTIGVLAEDINADFIPGIICGITEYAENHGYHILLDDLHMLDKLYNRYENLPAYRRKVNQSISYLLEYQVDGVIYIGMNDRIIENIIDPIDRPLVYSYCYSANRRDYSVSYDNEKAAYEVMQYLSAKGHEHVGILAGPENSVPSERRLAGIRRFCAEQGCAFPVLHGNWEYEEGRTLTETMLEHHPRVTAIFAMNDLMAAGCLDVLKERGLFVPGNLSVFGFDDRKMAAFLSPRLTTMALPLKDMGTLSAQILIDLCTRQASGPYQRLLPCTRIERDSVGDHSA